MLPFVEVDQTNSRSWVYVSLSVRDGERLLKPTHVSFDHIRFAEPPRLVSKRVEIIIVNGDAEQRHIAAVAPHPEDATCIPIQLVAGP
ncbi:MAG TPA: hypothetical protein VHY37_08975 [Tepidisphaeraceae bacterium]|nr:hypothetical protein [Tepidisphaeraceae bacterium]